MATRTTSEEAERPRSDSRGAPRDTPDGATVPEVGSGGPDPTGPSVRRQAVVGFLVLFVVFAVSPNTDGGDGYLALPTAHSLVRQGDLDLGEFHDAVWYERHYAQVEVGDRQVDYFPWMTAVVAVPAVALWELGAAAGALPEPGAAIRADDFAQARILVASLVAAAAAVALGLVTRRLLLLVRGTPDAHWWLGPRDAWSLTLWIVVLGLGTSLWSTASRSLWQHGPSLLLGGLAVLCALSVVAGRAPLAAGGARHAVWWHAAACGALLALAYWVRPTNLVLALGVVGLVLVRQRRATPPLLLGLVGTHALVVLANLALLGRSVPPYFASGRVGVHGALVEAVGANLVSPARGLLLFSPFLLGALALALPARRRLLGRDLGAVCVMSVAVAVGVLFAVSAYGEKWWAGHSFGPRFMSEALVVLGPLALVGIFGPRTGRASSTLTRAVWAVAILCGVLVHAGGALSSASTCWNRAPVSIDQDPSRVWDVGDAQLTAAYVGSPLRSTERCSSA